MNKYFEFSQHWPRGKERREEDSGEMAEEGHRHHADVVLQPTEVENITEGRGLKQIRCSLEAKLFHRP